VAVQRDVVVVGASAGGVEALRRIVRQLPADFPAAVLVVLHLAPAAPPALPQILGRAGLLRAIPATDGAPLTPGVIHVAPPGHHLLLDDGTLALTRGPAENGHRPAVNATFRSAALAAGPRVIGVVLSGTLRDGTSGLATVVERGGLAVVQDPADALYPGMPESALARVPTEHVYPAEALGKVLDRLVRQQLEPVATALPRPALLLEDRIARGRAGGRAPGSGYTCPDCHGPLLETGGEPSHYRCRVGHAWTAEALLEARDTEFEHALWTALRSLEEKEEITQRMKQDAAARGHDGIVRRHAETARECAAAAETLRRFLISLGSEAKP
jgi:two-component system chemotaxis response regulator CheB